jgi:hypothetical protein
MSPYLAALEQEIGSFGQVLVAAGLDVRVVMVTDHGGASTEVCVGPPLSGTTNCNLPAVGTSRFDHYDVNVQSLDSLCVLLDGFDGTRADEAGLFPGGWQTLARAEAAKVLVVVSDDGARCTTAAGESFDDGNTVAGGEQAATAFDAALLSRSPAHFGTPAERRYVLHAVIAIAPKAPPAAPYAPEEPVTAVDCAGNSASGTGTGYQWLAKNTGGLRFPICSVAEFDPIFQRIAQEVVQRFAPAP